MPTTQAWALGVAAAQGMEEVWIPYVAQRPEQRGEPVHLDAAFFRRLFKRTTGLAPGADRKRFRIPDFARP